MRMQRTPCTTRSQCSATRSACSRSTQGALLPPLGETPQDWQGFPCVIRIVDRGPLGMRTSDIGAMELFAEPVVASDPFGVAEALRPVALKEQQ